MFEQTPIHEKSWRGALKRLALRIKEHPFLYRVLSYLFRLMVRIKRRLLNNSSRYKITPKISAKQRKAESEVVFEREIKFSILVPLYNTPKKFLADMVNSVLNQTYGNWQLCLADGSDEGYGYIGEYIKSLNDERICYKKLEKNKGISENTNECIALANGEYIALFDHDDVLHPSALFEMMKVICEKDADFIYTDEVGFKKNRISDVFGYNFKSDYGPDTLRSYNYICHFSAFSRQLLEKVGYFRSEFDGSQDYDLILRLTENAECIVHIPKALYFWRSHELSVAWDISAKPYAVDAAKRAIQSHLDRVGLKGRVEDAAAPTTYKIQYEIEGEPLISIIIPNKDHTEDLEKCLSSIYGKSTYKNFEILVVENNSTEPETFEYYKGLGERYHNSKVITWDGGFNYSAINNFAAKRASGEYVLLLNNDIEIITPDWMEQMLMFAQREDVGAVGAKLYYPDDTIQHAGAIIGLGGVAAHSHRNFTRESFGHMSRLCVAQNLSACTAACLLVKKSVFDEIDGLEEKFAVAFNDMDLCMKIRRAGYLIVFTPFAECYHYESKSRGYEDTPEKRARYNKEAALFQERWAEELKKGDPYYNPNLTLSSEDFAIDLTRQK